MARRRHHHYVPRFDGNGGGDDDDVGDLDFNILFTPGHNHHNHQRRRPFTDDDWDPTGPNTEVGRRWRSNIQEAFQREGREHGEWAELPTWYIQMHTKLWQDRRRERGEDVLDLRDPNPFGNDQRGNQQGRTRQHNHDDAASDDSDGMIFDLDLDDDDDRHVVPAMVQRDPPIEHDYIADLTAQVTRQQRYVANIRDQLNLPAAAGDGGHHGVTVALRHAEDALRTLQEALEEAQNQHDADPQEPRDQTAAADAGDLQDRGGGHPIAQGDADNDDEDEDGRRGRQRRRSRSRHNSANARHRRPPGLDAAARRQTERSLARLREALQQMQWMGAAPREQHEVAAEIAYLQDVLAGRFAQWGRGQHSPTNSSPSPSPSPTRQRRHRRRRGAARRELGCYAPPAPLSAEDPRLPPRGVAREEPVELWDAEGPRFLALLLLDNPAAAAAARKRDVERVARERFARYREAQFFTVVERAMEGGALRGLSSGPRGVVWVVEAGREDVVGALLRAREEPFGIRSWEVLGVGVGAAEGVVFVLHDGGGEEGSASGDGGSGSGSD